MENPAVTRIHNTLCSMGDGFNDAAQLRLGDSEYRHCPASMDITGDLLEAFMMVPADKQKDFVRQVFNIASGYHGGVNS